VPEAVKTITAKEIGGHLRFLASDLMKGRDTASDETRLAGEYLASHLFAAGAEPLGESVNGIRTYFQNFPLEVTTPHVEGTELTITISQNGSKRVIPCKLGADFLIRPFGIVPGEIEAPIVFASHGQVDGDKKIDDYEGLAVKNQFVLVYEGRHGDASGGSRRQSPIFNPFSKLEPARKNGAIGVLVIEPPGRQSPPSRNPFNPQQLGFERPSMALGSSEPSIPVIKLSDDIRDILVEALGLEADSKSKAIEGDTRVQFRFASTKEMKTDRNVIGYFPGTDEAKKKEVIIFSAHYDHVGVNEKGEIHNGSDDNASGTSALLEIAEAFGNGPKLPRSVAFLWVSGEEKGLLGSQWYSDHVTLPEDYKIVADINLDMVSRNNPHKIGVTPSPSHEKYNTLVTAAQAVSKDEEMEIVFDADQYFFRTDSFNFARKEIPVIFFFAGIHEDYHRPTDDIEKADLDKSARVARLAYRLAWKIGQEPDIPKAINTSETKPAESH
jgi:Zn-dependent M28 family amino/carboxypeptidase